MPLDRGGRDDLRQRRAFQKLGALPLQTLGLVEGGGIDFDFNTNSISVALAMPSGLEFDGSADLRIDIGQSPSILAIDGTGLITQYVTANGSGANIGVSMLATGTGFAVVQCGPSGQARLESVGGAFCVATTNQILFGSGSTQYQIDGTVGLLGSIDASTPGIAFDIQDTSFSTSGIKIDGLECALTGFYANFADGTPIRIQPQLSLSTAPAVTVIGAIGDGVQGGLACVEGGTTMNVGADTDAGLVCIRGGIPEGTGNSQVLIQAQDPTPTVYTVIETGLDTSGQRILGFYGVTPVARQSTSRSVDALHTSLVNLGLISDAGGSSAKGGLVYVNSSVPGGNTVANTVTETAFSSSYTIPANSLAVGDVIRIKLWGVYGVDAVAPTMAVRIKIGGTTFVTTGSITPFGGVTDGGWTAEFQGVVHAIGGSGSVDAQALFEFTTAVTTGLIVNAANTSATSLDTTANQTITVTVEWGTADADNTITLRHMAVEILRVQS